jgi:HD-GYP domain-containing protein (c-di-GMP phosphodiesterase class II)
MTSEHPYRKPLSHGEARNELMTCAGKQFDPNIVSVFLDVLKEMEEVFLVKDHPKTSAISY